MSSTDVNNERQAPTDAGDLVDMRLEVVVVPVADVDGAKAFYYGSFASFRDPDGNGWLLQEIKIRLPGR